MSKPINEMDINQALDALREARDLMEPNHAHGGWIPNYDNLAQLADRIHELTRWIPVEERLPTEKDGDRHGYVQWWSEDEVAIPVAHCWDFPFAHYWDFTGVPKYTFTHWRRIDRPEGV